jgi:endoglucanase
MTVRYSLASILLVLFGPTQVPAQQLTGVPPSRYNHFTKGVNLEFWFQCMQGGIPCSSTNTAYLPITASDIQTITSVGLDYVRLSVDPRWLLPDAFGPVLPNVELTSLDSAIDSLISANLGVDLVMMDDGSFANLMVTSPARVQQLVTLWQTLAQRYGNRNPDLLMFEILNEPPSSFSPSFWDGIERQVILAIRSAAPQHTIIATSANWSDANTLISVTPILPDPNVIYVFHEYSPNIVTHQCRGPLAAVKSIPYPPYLGNLPSVLAGITDSNIKAEVTTEFNENWYSGRYQRLMQIIAAWARTNQVRVMMNEMGIFRPSGEGDLQPGCRNPTDADRGRYLGDVRMAAEANGIGWNLYDYGESAWGLLLPNSRQPDPVILGALGLGPSNLPAIAPPPFFFSGAEPVQYGPALRSIGNTESSIVVDVNGDGLPDLVVASLNPVTTTNPIEFFLNDGSGGLINTPTLADLSVVTKWVDVIAAGRFDGSGRPGLFFADEGPHDGTGGQNLLLLPSSNGSYRNATPTGVPQQIASTYSADAADIDGDGFDDLVLFNGPPVNGSFSNRLPLQILHNDGTGNFTISKTALPSSITDISSGGNLYMNGKFITGRIKGAADLLVLGTSGSKARLLFNDGAGHFQPGPLLPPTGPNSPAGGQCVIVDDLNGDGYPDLIIAFVTYPSQSYLQVLINNGDFTFRDETALMITQVDPSFGIIRGMYMAKTNGGKNRLLMVTALGQSPILKLDDGNGVFRDVGTPYSGGATDGSWNGVLALLNSDGYADVVFGPANPNSSAVKVMWGLKNVQALGATPPSTTTTPSVSRLLNAASYAPLTSPGTWTAVFGSNFLPAGTPARTWMPSEIVNGHLPMQLDNVSVLINGTPAYVYYISPSQIDVQTPDGAARGYVPVEVDTLQGKTSSTVNISDLSPALFTVGTLNGSQLVAAVALDGTYIADPTVVRGSRGARPGETIEIYGTGFGPTTPPSPAGMLLNPAPLSNAAAVTIGSTSITPEFSGIVGPGLYQLNIQIPAGLTNGDYLMQVRVAGMQTQPNVVIPVRGAQ